MSDTSPSGQPPKIEYAVPPPEGQWLRGRVARQLRELTRLAMPVAISRAGILLLMTADFAMLGRVGTEDMAHYALGSTVFLFLMILGIGLMFGTMVLTSHAIGRGALKECGAIWRGAQPWALFLGLGLSSLTLLAEDILLAVGQDPSLAAGAAKVAAMLGLGLTPMLFYAASSLFLEALRRPLRVMVMIGCANALNLLLNPYFVAASGFSGAEGAALTTTISRIVMAVGVMAFVWWLPDRATYDIRNLPRLRDWGIISWWRNSQQLRRYGYASGMAYGLESLAFSMMQIFAGLLGATASAVFGLGMNLTALLFMAGLGLATATAVRVGIAHGRRDMPDRALAGWVGLGVALFVMAVFCVVLTLETDWVASLFTDDATLLPALLPAIFLIGFIMLGDGAQIVLSNALRAAADPWSATVLNFMSYFCIQIPLGYYLALHLGRGVQGLFEAIFIAACVSVFLLGSRWVFICVRDKNGPDEAVYPS